MAKRLDLRAFQQDLNDRMQDRSRQGGQQSLLGVQIAGQNWLVDMSDISEVLSLPRLTSVPLSQDWFRGVANVRGNLYGVVDIAAYLQNGAASGEATNRILLLAERYGFNTALLVDGVLGLRDTSEWRRSVEDGAQFIDKQGVSWRSLAVVELVEQPEFLQIGI
ncbi:MAG: chemotaxis protein CheW [Gallionella sp.]|nr:chemotaxis protein CheW [Gallionella sp.]MDD5612366.1 chemotaxis protein CheW [Gallionella sp.]